MREDIYTEYKSAKGGFPNSFWETFSAFANTAGGDIVLGIKETDGKFVADGLSAEQAEKLLKVFWDNSHNKSCISAPLLVEKDVEVQPTGGGMVLRFHVPRAPYALRPVYLTPNPFGHTYKRNHEGDYLCSDAEVRLMFADANHTLHPADGRILRGFSMEDIDIVSLHAYRRLFDANHDQHPWSVLTDIDFLKRLGGYRIDRAESCEGFTVAGILFFGKHQSIIDEECCPWYFVDYRERLGFDEQTRWTNRVYPDGTWEANLFQFYTRVLPMLYQALPVPFHLASDGMSRLDYTTAHLSLREALTNALVHASYSQPGNIVVERTMQRITISNPGSMLISLEEFLEGGHSECRNPSIQRMFMEMGRGEKAGSGAETIRKGWTDNQWDEPRIIESTSPDRVEIRFVNIETISSSYLKQGKKNLADKRSIKVFLADKWPIKDILADKLADMLLLFAQSKQVSTDNIVSLLGISQTTAKRYLRKLQEMGYINSEGENKNRTYVITEIGKSNILANEHDN